MTSTICEELSSLSIKENATIENQSFLIKAKECDEERYFMKVAMVAAMRSKDPAKQVGCVIADENHRVVSTGYNGFPIGCHDDVFPWTKDDPDELKNKHAYVVHAEMNALANKRRHTLHNCTVYVTLFPCNSCTKLLIQSRVKRIVYYEDRDTWQYVASKKMLDMAGIKYDQYIPRNETEIIKL
ncbi:unnamed protein product [Caenorhabditis bovis]|uniref:Probable deoxycytidylate deaminase n=1 Tax=Caenorhabditis bovis TaxID=2654633 RepID=A0A8S1EJM6_9PELO|nr:unnamed protein product [Caenorhabditis bovis]